MENKSGLITSIIVAVVALAAGLGLVYGIGISVQSAMTPLNGSLQMILAKQMVIEKKVADASSADVNDMKKRISDLESKLAQMNVALANAQRPQQPQAPTPMAPPSEDMNKFYDLPLEGSYVFGKADAPATITIFNDYQCPFCSRFYPAAREAVKALPNKAKLVLKHFPLGFHPQAKPAAKAALAAGLQGKFYEMSDLIFQNAAALSDDKYKELAKQLGLNVDKFNKDLKEKDAEFEKKILVDMALATKADVRGTPTYFLNGKKSMARDVETWKKEIEAAIAVKK